MKTVYTDEQQAVINHGKGPALCIATAGSGKSTALIARIGRLLKEGTRSEKICAITFSKKASEDLQLKYRKNHGRKAAQISTFHSLGRTFLVEETMAARELVGLRRGFKILPDTRFILKELLGEKMRDGKRGMNWRVDLGRAKAIISHIKREVLDSPSSIVTELREKNISDGEAQKFVALFELYTRYMRTNNYVDFDDLIYLPCLMVQKAPGRFDNWRDTYDYLMIDEYQDNNLVQVRFAEIFYPRDRSVLMVGDDSQAIYKFIGAIPEQTIYGFKDKFPDGKVYLLNKNFRSREALVNTSNKLIEFMPNPYGKKAAGVREGSTVLRTKYYNDNYEEAHDFVDSIIVDKENGTPLNHNAILYRVNKQSRALEDALIKKRLPYVIHGAVSFYLRREVQDMFAYLKVAHDPTDSESLSRVINIPSIFFGKNTRYLGAAFLSTMTQEALQYKTLIGAMLCSPKVNGLQKKAIEDLTKLLEKIALQETVAKALTLLAEQCYTEYIKHEYGIDDDDGDDTRLEIISEFIRMSQDFGSNFDEFFEYITNVQEMNRHPKGPEFEAVNLMTIHKSKGLEWPNVYLCGMSDGLLPFYKSGVDTPEGWVPQDVAEERRIAYVGVTRAADNLVLSSVRNAFNREGMKPSMFLTEMKLGV